MAKEFKEKIITINLRKAFNKPETKRAKAALYLVKQAVKKETRKTEFRVSNAVNEKVWSRGLKKSLRHITVKVIPDKEIARIYLPEEKVEEKKKAEKGKKAEIKKEEPKAAEKKETKTTPEKEKPAAQEKK